MMRFKTFCIGFLLVIALSALTACSQPKPEDAVASFLDHLIAGEYEAAAAFVEGDFNYARELDASSDKILESIFAKVSYDIKSSSVNGDTAVVSTEIVAPNLTILFGQALNAALPMAFATAFSDEDFNQEAMDQFFEETFISLLSDPNVAKTATTIDIHLHKSESGWKIDVTDELANAITGGFLKAFEKFN